MPEVIQLLVTKHRRTIRALEIIDKTVGHGEEFGRALLFDAGLPRQTVSEYLMRLRDCGFVKCLAKGRYQRVPVNWEPVIDPEYAKRKSSEMRRAQLRRKARVELVVTNETIEQCAPLLQRVWGPTELPRGPFTRTRVVRKFSGAQQ